MHLIETLFHFEASKCQASIALLSGFSKFFLFAMKSETAMKRLGCILGAIIVFFGFDEQISI